MLHYFTIRNGEYVHLGSTRHGWKPLKAILARLRGEDVYTLGC